MNAKIFTFGFRLPKSTFSIANFDFKESKTSNFLQSNTRYLAVVNKIPVYKRLGAIATYSVCFSHHKVLCLVATGSFILNLIALPHCGVKSQTVLALP